MLLISIHLHWSQKIATSQLSKIFDKLTLRDKTWLKSTPTPLQPTPLQPTQHLCCSAMLLSYMVQVPVGTVENFLFKKLFPVRVIFLCHTDLGVRHEVLVFLSDCDSNSNLSLLPTFLGTFPWFILASFLPLFWPGCRSTMVFWHCKPWCGLPCKCWQAACDPSAVWH